MEDKPIIEVDTLQINEVHGISLPEGVMAVQEPQAQHELMEIASIRAEAYYEEQPHRCAFLATRVHLPSPFLAGCLRDGVDPRDEK